MKKAIGIGYAINQNEPSRPLPFVIDVPDDMEQSNNMLRTIFFEHICKLDSDDGELIIHYNGSEHDYGDIIVSWNDEVFLYLTFIEE